MVQLKFNTNYLAHISKGTILSKCKILWVLKFNILRPRQNSGHFPDDIVKCTFLNGNVWISIKISLKFVPKGPISNIPAFVQIMAWCRPGNKPLSEPIMVSLLMHICVTCPQWVKSSKEFLKQIPDTETLITLCIKYSSSELFKNCWLVTENRGVFHQDHAKSPSIQTHVQLHLKWGVLIELPPFVVVINPEA